MTTNTTYAAIITMLVTLLSLCSCSQNDGDIGDLYGIWTLRTFCADDLETTLPAGAEYCFSLKFQSKIVQYSENLPLHEHNSVTGIWVMRSDSIFFDFTGRNTPQSVASRNPEPEITPASGFPANSVTAFKINTISGTVLDISTTYDGKNLRYYFEKLN